MIPALIGAGAVLGTGVLNTVHQNKINEQNFELQKNQMLYNQWFSENQHQIAARDLEAAGLSKTLAAGAGNTIQSMSAPQRSATDFSQVNPLTGLMQVAQIGSTLAGMKLAQEQAKTQQKQQEYIGQQTNNAVLDGVMKGYNNDAFSTRFGMEQGRYENEMALGKNTLSDSAAKRYNIYQRLELDRLLNAARIGNLEQSTANAKLQHQINTWDYQTARNAGLATKGRSALGNITNDVFGTFQKGYDATLGRWFGKMRD